MQNAECRIEKTVHNAQLFCVGASIYGALVFELIENTLFVISKDIYIILKGKFLSVKNKLLDGQ